ncbi:hypothetical protein TWF225_011752 [Orbilia oligospora]|nr:hypothetical protein TWF225_011752 [Orbilia oligospora]KAF3236356.1 hypothetical protein TWF217_002563 [Orbilia oligospora]KAF3255207.1 hypothetical protein TWF128_006002 [Orbilia oligospora]KAF3298372.1 hypothetical protein TWF132_000194 [Orbilia oligospora]
MAQITPITVRVVNRFWIKENPDNVNTNNHKYCEIPAQLQAMEQALDQSEYYRRLTETGYDLWKPILQRMQREAKEMQEPTSPCNGGYEIILTPSLCRLLKSAADGGLLMGRIPRSLEEDLEEQVLPLLAPCFGRQSGSSSGPKYFVRLNSCSPKDGTGEHGPFEEAWPILLSLCTSERVQKALRDLLEHGIRGDNENSRNLKLDAYEILHLNPWRDEISTLNEFRIFVPPNGKVRAISQYSIRSGGWADDSNKKYEKIKSLVPCMIECNTRFRALVRGAGKELPKGGYVLDVHVRLLSQGAGNSAAQKRFEWSVEPIEINPFGAQLASGSGIFQWLTDWECMYGLSNDIVVALVYDDCRKYEDE